MRLSDDNASLRCDYCHSVMMARADETGVQFIDEAADLVCPSCAAALWTAILAGVRIHACKQCHGLLVAMGAFEALIDKMRGEHPETVIPVAADAADLKRKVACPACRHEMETHFYYGGGHGVMSTCERCELHWLDGGVLLQIVQAPREEEASSY